MFGLSKSKSYWDEGSPERKYDRELTRFEQKVDALAEALGYYDVACCDSPQCHKRKYIKRTPVKFKKSK